jgi:hypothetical protein
MTDLAADIQSELWSLPRFLMSGQVFAVPLEGLLNPDLFTGLTTEERGIEFSTELSAAEVCRAFGLPNEWEAEEDDIWPTLWRYREGLEFRFADTEEATTRHVKIKLDSPAQLLRLPGKFKNYVVATDGWRYDKPLSEFLRTLLARGAACTVAYRIDGDDLRDLRVAVDGGATLLFEEGVIEEEDDVPEPLTYALETTYPDGIYAWAAGAEPSWEPCVQLSGEECLRRIEVYKSKYPAEFEYSRSEKVQWWP